MCDRTEILRVFVLAEPNRPISRVETLPEEFHGIHHVATVENQLETIQLERILAFPLTNPFLDPRFLIGALVVSQKYLLAFDRNSLDRAQPLSKWCPTRR